MIYIQAWMQVDCQLMRSARQKWALDITIRDQHEIVNLFSIKLVNYLRFIEVGIDYKALFLKLLFKGGVQMIKNSVHWQRLHHLHPCQLRPPHFGRRLHVLLHRCWQVRPHTHCWESWPAPRPVQLDFYKRFGC